MQIHGIVGEGSNLCREAKKKASLVTFGAVLSTEKYETNAPALLSHKSCWYDGIKGSVTGCRVSENSAKLTIEFPLIDGAQALKSYAVTVEFDGQKRILAAFTDNNSQIFIDGTETVINVDLAISLVGCVEEFGTVYDVVALAVDVEKNADDISTLNTTVGQIQEAVGQLQTDMSTIAGEYISDLSYNEDTHILTATSPDGTKEINIDLS